MTSASDQFQKLMGHVLGNQASWFTTIGLTVGLFAAIDPRYVQVWCLGSYAFELLDWDEASGYPLAPHRSRSTCAARRWGRAASTTPSSWRAAGPDHA